MKNFLINQVFFLLMVGCFFSCEKSNENPKGHIKVSTSYTPSYSGICGTSYLEKGYAKVMVYNSNGTLVGTQKSTGNATLDFGAQDMGTYYVKIHFTETTVNSCDGSTTKLTQKKGITIILNSAITVLDVQLK